MTISEKIVKEELKELEDNTRKIKELAKEVCLCGYDPKHPETPRMDIVCPRHDRA